MKNAECRTQSAEHKNKPALDRDGVKFSLAIRHSSFVILLSLLFAILFPAATFAQSSNRWLLIFDVSSSMHSRAKGTEDIMQDLLSTGMHGQIRHGDTIGIWTFNDKLHAGEAPLQVWSPEMAQIIDRHTLQYVEGLRYGKTANLQVVLTNMFNVVDASDFITVILFSDGGELLRGTPFDDQINAQYKQNFRQQKKADLPFVTVLQAKHGNFTTNTVNFGPWPVEIPSTPLPPPPKRLSPQTSPAPKPAPPPPPTAPPIIYDGRKTSMDAPAAPPPTAETNSLTVASADNSGGSAPAVMAEQAPAPKAEPPQPVPTVPAQSTQAALAPPAQVSLAGQPPTQAAATPSAPPATQNESQPPSPQPEAATKQPAALPVVETAASAPTPNLMSARNIAIVSVAFGVIVCGLLLMAARRSRSSETSLITRSLERENR